MSPRGFYFCVFSLFAMYHLNGSVHASTQCVHVSVSPLNHNNLENKT